MNWKDKFKGKVNLEKKAYRLVGEHILPEDLIRQGGYDPNNFPISDPPTFVDAQKSLLRIKELDSEEKLKLFKIEKSLGTNLADN